MKITHNPSLLAVKELLNSARLPTADITTEHMEHFLGAWSDSTLEGVVGVERYGTVALLRSLAVAASKQGSGLGSRLLSQAEQYAAERGVRSLFLLTTTAAPYFDKRGYACISRTAVSEAIRNTAEFTSLCPASSVLMVKHMRSDAGSWPDMDVTV